MITQFLDDLILQIFQPFLNPLILFDANNIYVASRNNYFSSDPINLKISVALLDSSLNLKGWKWFGGDKNYSTYTVTATSDGGCVIGGTVCDWQNSPSGDVDLWIKKIFPDDIITNAEETPDPYDSDVAIYPNPGSDFFFVKTIRKNLLIKVFSSSGIPVMQEEIENFPTYKINTYGLKNGVYTYQIIDKYKNIIIESGTWIKN
ncbi:MAG: T9SS type A sorting domain-containing protein [Bacteroidales bacterium]